MGKIKGFLFAVRHREILMTDLGLMDSQTISKNTNRENEVSHGMNVNDIDDELSQQRRWR